LILDMLTPAVAGESEKKIKPMARRHYTEEFRRPR
jgi:hypothetical protein